ncbi:hypothetical protein [Citrobacter sedlakii]|uniref:hypothetical protein n=1 Tax=Citrobacter sedlakii TaxID=67826 RepID=UPI0020BEB60C|nr:hypothetical protein [Citrobacter sedlakii]MCK8148027.1 hypothetical protein [Citrobacter sedlakii]
MKVKHLCFFDFCLLVASFVFSVAMLDYNFTDLLMLLMFPQILAVVSMVRYAFAKHVLKLANRSDEMRSSIDFTYLTITFLVSLILCLVCIHGFYVPLDSIEYLGKGLFLLISLSIASALCVILAGIYLVFPVQAKLAAGFYKKIIN